MPFDGRIRTEGHLRQFQGHHEGWERKFLINYVKLKTTDCAMLDKHTRRSGISVRLVYYIVVRRKHSTARVTNRNYKDGVGPRMETQQLTNLHNVIIFRKLVALHVQKGICEILRLEIWL